MGQNRPSQFLVERKAPSCQNRSTILRGYMRETCLTLGFVALGWLPAGTAASDEVSLRFLRSIEIAVPSEGFDEPSDLSLDPTGQILWSVSDDTPRIFALDPNGKLDLDRSISVDANGLEGIAILPSAKQLLATKEDTNEILKIEIATGR